MKTRATDTLPESGEVVSPHQLVWMHIRNPGHIITDEALKKVVVGLELEQKTSPQGKKQITNNYLKRIR